MGLGWAICCQPPQKGHLCSRVGNSRYEAGAHQHEAVPVQDAARLQAPSVLSMGGAPDPKVPPRAQGARRNRVTSPPRCSHISFNSNIRVLNIHREIGIGSHLQCFQIHSFEVQRQIKKTLRSKIVHPCGTTASRCPNPAPCPGSRTEEQCHEGQLGLPGPREASQVQRLSGQRPCRGRVRQDGTPGPCRRTRVRAGVSPRRIFPEKKRKKYSVM